MFTAEEARELSRKPEPISEEDISDIEDAIKRAAKAGKSRITVTRSKPQGLLFGGVIISSWFSAHVNCTTESMAATIPTFIDAGYCVSSNESKSEYYLSW